MFRVSSQFETILSDIESSYIILAETFTLGGRYHIAINACKDALRINPQNIETLYILTRLYISLFKKEEAEACVKKIWSRIVRTSPRPEYLYLVCKAHLHLKKNEVEKAYQCIQKIFQFKPKHDDYFIYVLSLFYEITDEYELSAKIISKKIKSFAQFEISTHTLFRLGFFYIKTDDHNKAYKIFDFLLLKSHIELISRLDIKVMLIILIVKRRDYNTALRECYNMIREESNYVFSYMLLFWIFMEQSEYKKLYEFQKKIEGRFNNPYMFYLAGRACVELGRENEAIIYYKRSLKYDKNNECVWNSLGIIYYKKKQYEEAKTKYLTALGINKAFVECKKNIEILFRSMKISNDEIKLYKKNNYIPNDFAINNKQEQGCYFETDADITKSPYIKPQVFLTGQLYSYDKNRVKEYYFPLKKMFDIDSEKFKDNENIDPDFVFSI